ncbi:Na/Pi cotransporter family protein [Evansella tamaricis]|uniref:Na/Pi cotransporter family protein n=1 Tax=Evansella tamaricis TaxID=2069301 RepID=A0ABS6JGR7_9BACI|nr:Na/Pi cotransporter family protein [Evansella tamaricis]MBU9712876.1 Na/Pi cotransporter family protein [Evansella tamaricis]
MNIFLHTAMGMLGGLGIFLYGMYIASEGLKKSSSKHLKEFLKKVTTNQLFGAFAGVVLAAVMQSSSAATVMVVGFVNAGLMTLRQAMGVMLGTAIGTTITVQLIAFKMTDYSLLFIAIGSFLFIIGSSTKVKSIASIFLGFGFVFFGMGIITDAMAPLQTNPEFMNAFVYLSDHLILMVLASLLFTAIIQNSAATIALAMSLGASGTLQLETAIAIVYGANAGTVVTALISSINTTKDAKRTAVAHAFFKLIGVLIFLPLTEYFAVFMESIGSDIERQIANAHSIFNIVNLLILLPFCNKFADWMLKLIPEKKETIKEVKYIDPESLEVPTVALMKTKKELERMAKIIDDNMFIGIDRLLRNKDSSKHDTIIKNESKIDVLYKSIYHYLQKITKKDISDDESVESLKYLYINSDLEEIADSLQQITYTLMKLDERNIKLNDKELSGITNFYKEVRINYIEAIKGFEGEDKEMAIKMIQQSPGVLRIEKKLRYEHFHNSDSESSRLSSTYIRIINELLKINQRTVSISHTTIGLI